MSPDDLLRSCYVLSVGGLDSLLVTLCADRFRRIWQGSIPPPRKFGRIKLSAQGVLDYASQAYQMEQVYRTEIQFRAYQDPERIREYVAEVYEAPFWPAVGAKLGADASTIKSTLTNIVSRRNRIVHEGDINPTYGGSSEFPVYPSESERALSFIENLGPACAKVLQ